MNWKQIQQTLAKEFDLPIEEVKYHTDGYWKYIISLLHKPGDKVIKIPSIGYWHITPRGMFNRIASLLYYLQGVKWGVNKKNKAIEESYKNDLGALWKLKQITGWINTSKRRSPSHQLRTKHELSSTTIRSNKTGSKTFTSSTGE